MIEKVKARFYRIKCGEWRHKDKDLNVIKNNLLNKTLSKVKNGDILYIENIKEEIPTIWNGFRIFYNKKMYSIGGNPSLTEIQYLPDEENMEYSNVVNIPNSYITNILLKVRKSKIDKDLLNIIKSLDYSTTFNYEKKRYKKEYELQIESKHNIWNSYNNLSPSNKELIQLKNQIKKIKKLN